MALPVTITGINTTVAPVGPFKVAAGTYDAVAINQTISFAGSVSLTGTGTTVALGLKLTNAASSATISSVAISIGKQNSPTDAHWIEITQTDPTGTVLATSDQILASAMSGTVLWTFPTPATISASATFGIVFRRTGADALNCTTFSVGGNSGGSTGAAYQYNGTTWSATGSPWGLVVNKQTTIASDAFYFFGRNGTTATTLSAFKSTAPDTSWSSVATKTGFTTAILNLAACKSGNIIHILVQDGTASTALATKYVSFDAVSDTFLATTETVSAAVAVTGQVAGANANASLVVRSNGEVVAHYSGVQAKVSGTFRMHTYYRRRTAVNTWSTETMVDANAAVDARGPFIVLGASDRCHLFYYDGGAANQRHLTSANVLGTAAGITGSGLLSDIVSFDDGGTIRHVGFGNNVFRFASADNPTISTASLAYGSPGRGVDDNLIVYVLYQNAADSDLYIKSSSDDGATFGSATNVFTGTVASADANLSKNQTAYARGSSVVFPYIVNDNGTLKYNESVVRTTAVTNVGTASGAGAAAAVGTGIDDGVGSTPLTAGAASATGTAIVYRAITAAGTGAATATGTAIVGVAVTATGVGAVSGAGEAGTGVTTSATATAAATSTAAATGAASAAIAVTAPATSTATASGATVAQRTVTAAGTGTAQTTGAYTAHRAVTAAGTGTATTTGTAITASVGAAAGTSTATGSASATTVNSGAGAAAGTSTLTQAVGVTLFIAAGQAPGVGAGTATGRATAAISVIAAGTSTAAATGTGLKPVGVTATATSSAAATGATFAAGAGAATGVGTATATGAIIGQNFGAAAGIGVAVAGGASTAVGRMVAAGTSTATATGQRIVFSAAVAAATATSTAQATGRAFVASTANVVGTGTATATSHATIASVGNATGIGSAQAGGQWIIAAVAFAAGVGLAAATGFVSTGNIKTQYLIARRTPRLPFTAAKTPPLRIVAAKPQLPSFIASKRPRPDIIAQRKAPATWIAQQ